MRQVEVIFLDLGIFVMPAVAVAGLILVLRGLKRMGTKR